MKLEVINAEPVGPDIIEKLDELYDIVRQGKVSSIGIAVVYRDGTTGTSYSNAPSIGLLIASTTRLQHRLLKIGEE